MIRVDTNYIIRYLINDNAEMANIAEKILTTKNVSVIPHHLFHLKLGTKIA